jgi:tripartite-type tricarboxylate transporter receptor subunit TctC
MSEIDTSARLISRRAFCRIAVAACAVALAVSAAPAAAQSDYPNKPVKIIVPYQPGGATDIIARVLANQLTESTKQSFVVENRPGASGNLALEAVARAPADGYTLLIGNVSTNAINENTFAHVLPIKPSRDLAGVTKLVEIPHIVAVTANFPANSLADFIAMAKKDPGKINYASAGLGSYPHLDMEKLAKKAGIQLTHVPYKGGAGQMIPALIAGEINVMFINLSSALSHVRAGKLKPIATTAPKRLEELPEVPTMAEQGFAGIGTNAWQGMFVPAATPKPVIEKLHAVTAAELNRAELKQNLSKQMMTVELSKSPQEFNDLVRKETQSWGDFLREAKIKIE